MLTIHQLLGNKQPQTPDTTLRQRQRHEHTALSPETPDLNSLNSFTMPPERKRTFYSMRQIDMLSKEDLITTRFPRFWRMQSCLTQIPLGLWAGCTIVLMSALILLEGCFYWQQEQELSPLNQGRSLLVALQQDQALSLPQPQMQALSPSQALTLSPAALDPEAVTTVATTAQLANTSALDRKACTDS